MQEVMSSFEEKSFEIGKSYKNLLEKFNPSAREVVVAGKGYLKALHGASDASKSYLDALTKLSIEVQQSSSRISKDFSSNLDHIVKVYQDIQAEQQNVLRSFYVDLVIPLEDNLDKDSKILQSELKRFTSCQKIRYDAFAKAENVVRKQKKKKSTSKSAIDKEIKNFQNLDAERANYSSFLDQSYNEVKSLELRRYNFLLDRLHCLGRQHFLVYSTGATLLQRCLEQWAGGAFSTPETNEQTRLSSIPKIDGEVIYSTPGEADGTIDESLNLQRSISLDDRLSEDGCPPAGTQTNGIADLQADLDKQEINAVHSMSRAKSDVHLNALHKYASVPRRPPFPRLHEDKPDKSSLARAIFEYQAANGNQLSFEEGDIITLIGDRNKGWQYGENHKTHQIGWFPLAYTEPFEDSENETSISEEQGKTYSLLPVSHKEKQHISVGRSRSRKRGRKIQTKDSFTSHSAPPPLRRKSSDFTTNETIKRQKPLDYNEDKHETDSDITLKDPPRTPAKPFRPHIFLTDDMGEDLQSYEGSYKGGSQNDSVVRSNQNGGIGGGGDKYTSFGNDNDKDDDSHDTSLCRSLTSPDLPACFQKSICSKESFQYSNDSGISNDDNFPICRPILSRSNSFCSQNYMNSLASSWTANSLKGKINGRNLPNNYQEYNGRSTSPTFLKYLYPSFKNLTHDYINKGQLQQETNNRKRFTREMEAEQQTIKLSFNVKKEGLSPCAQVIASQKAKKRNEKKKLRRSSSLLCIDIKNCGDAFEDTYASNYEYINNSLRNKIPSANFLRECPSPPPYDPPPLPIQKENHYISEHKNINEPSELPPEDYSIASSEFSLEKNGIGVHQDLTNNFQRYGRNRYLTRSFTWASADVKSYWPFSKIHKKNEISSSKTLDKLLLKSKQKYQPKTKQTNTNNKNNGLTTSIRKEPPPLPPRIKHSSPTEESLKVAEINILNYSEYMLHRLTNKDGTCRFDQRSITSGQKCSPWFNFWDTESYVENLV